MFGGCRDTRAVAPFFRFACHLAQWVPLPVLKAILYGAPAALVLFESLNWEHMRLYSRMVNDASVRQVRWSAGALLRYRSAGDPPGVRRAADPRPARPADPGEARRPRLPHPPRPPPGVADPAGGSQRVTCCARWG